MGVPVKKGSCQVNDVAEAGNLWEIRNSDGTKIFEAPVSGGLKVEEPDQSSVSFSCECGRMAVMTIYKGGIEMEFAVEIAELLLDRGWHISLTPNVVICPECVRR